MFVTEYFSSNSVHKKSTSSPWTIILDGPKGETITVVIDEKIQVGSNLKEILDSYEKSIVFPYSWPFEGRSVVGDDFVVKSVTMAGKRSVTQIDLTISAFKKIKSGMALVSKHSSSANPERYQDSNGLWSRYAMHREKLSMNADYMMAVEVISIADGDTINVKVLKSGKKAAEYYGVGSEYTVRYAGIDTAETKKAGEQSKDNSTYMNLFNITAEQAFKVGDEAKRLNESILKDIKGIIVVDVDINEDGSIKMDKYSRLLGMVHKTIYKNAEDVFDEEKRERDFHINLSRTMLDQGSLYVKDVPLAIPFERELSSGYKWEDYSRFDTSLWASSGTMYSEVYNDESVEALEREKEQDEATIKEELSKGLGKTYRVTIKHELDGKKSLDDILKEYGVSISDIREANRDLNIGDWETDDDVRRFVEDPENAGIDIKIPAIKTPEEIKDLDDEVVVDNPSNTEDPNRGQSEINGDNRLIFDAIGRDESLGISKTGIPPHSVRIGDTRFVIPPLSIEVSRQAKIQKIKTLRSKSSILVNTGTSDKVLTMQLYFHDLDNINGHLMENGDVVGDYYIDGLRPLIAQFKKAPFLPIENEYINEVHDIHNVALINLSVTTVPNFPRSLAATLTLAAFEHSAYVPHVDFLDNAFNYPMYRWYYQQVMRESNPDHTYLAPIKGRLTNDLYFEIAEEAVLEEKQEALRQLRQYKTPLIYEGDVAQSSNLVGKYFNDGERAKRIKIQQKRYEKLVADGTIDESKSYDINHQVRKTLYGGEPSPEGRFLPNAFSDPVRQGLIMGSSEKEELQEEVRGQDIYIIQLDSAANRDMMPVRYRVKKNLYLLPISKMSYLDRIVERGNAAKAEKDAYLNQYDKLKQKADMSEGQLPLVPLNIPNLIVTSLNVMYENSFSRAQVQLSDTPALQYLGSQDPYIHLMMETSSEESVRAIRDMVQTVERYSREYRYGITSGFLGLRNQLTELFGVRTVMPEIININTVPGFVDRYQIEMILCGFNKTQKRSETLNGISAYGTNEEGKSLMKQRSRDNAPDAKDASALESKLRDTEVYPDLELPTFDELNKVLPSLGASVARYHNPSGAKYLDPDFYVSSTWTIRNQMWEENFGKQPANYQMSLTDAMGKKGVSEMSSGNFFTPDASSVAFFDELDTRTRAVTIAKKSVKEGKTGYNMEEGMNEHNASGDSLDPNAGKVVNVGGSNVVKGDKYPTIWIPKKSDTSWVSIKNKENWTKAPTLKEYKGLVNASDGRRIQSEYDKAVTNTANPTDKQIYDAIYSYVDKYFVANGYAFKDDLKNEAHKKVIYLSSEDFYKAACETLILKDPGKYGKLKSLGKPSGIDVKEFSKLCWNAKKKIVMIPRERIANYLKAIFMQQSKWEQFEMKNGRNIPRVDSVTTGVGIGGIYLPAKANSKEHAQKLLWDWEYNIHYSSLYFFTQYTTALQQKDAVFHYRPWDWAVRAYEQGNFYKYTGDKNYEGKLATPFYGKHQNLFTLYYNSDSKSGFTPHSSGSNMDVVADQNGFNQHEKSVLSGDRTAMIEEILKVDPNAVVSGKNQLEIYKMYTKTMEDKMKEIMKMKNVSPNSDSWYTVDEETMAAIELYKTIKSNDESNPLKYQADTDSPQALFRDMWTDFCQYDQRGRLIRAFPAFQMFIIDEGRWMSSIRLWDNLYGFNAIQSIDVHRSREIAADTAVIEMTNVYSNLTSRTLDENYGDWQTSIWTNLIWGKPNEELLKARQELAQGMMLQTGARIHLRMGYGASAYDLPIVFNGKITEMNTEEVIQIIAQGDGMELTSQISGNPNEENENALGLVEEPRDLICRLLTSRGNWFKDAINYETGGKFFLENPLGIQHFGVPGEKTPEGNVKWFSTNYGKAAQNIYSSNGVNTFSQWLNRDGGELGWEFGTGFIPFWPKPVGDEMNVKLKIGSMTTWDVAQTLAMVHTDYIAAVHPFETRSTLFFGKPYWRLAYRYDKEYKKDPATGEINPFLTVEHRKPYMQFHMYESRSDIISNKIKASSEGMYTNVICTYDGKQTPIYYADWDIRYDMHRTAVVEAPIVSRDLGFFEDSATPGLEAMNTDFWTSEKQAGYFACSTVKDYMKKMYKGQLVVMGDPTVKPHDMCFLYDQVSDMNGPFLVRAVTHHFSHETGFITSIEPDAVAITDDTAILSFANWVSSAAMTALTYMMGKATMSYYTRKLTGSATLSKAIRNSQWAPKVFANAIKYFPLKDNDATEFSKGIEEYIAAGDDMEKKQKAIQKMQTAYDNLSKRMDEWSSDSKGLKKVGKRSLQRLLLMTGGILDAVDTGKDLTEGAKAGSKIFQFIKTGGSLISLASIPAAIINLFLFMGAEGLGEAYRRTKEERQCVLVIPLNHQGRHFTAGINGHQGMVVGDQPGKWDKFFMGMGYGGKDDFTKVLGKGANLLFDGGWGEGEKRYNYTYDEVNSNLEINQ